MIEFETDMEYCTEYEMLDEVVLNDENGEMEPVTFVPKAKAPGDTSDGYHTFDELYEHRTGLLAALCNVLAALMQEEGFDAEDIEGTLFKSWHHHDGEMFDGFFIVGINCNMMTGPWSKWATWHCEDKWWDRFVIPEIDRAPEWDGHTPADSLARLLSGPHATGRWCAMSKGSKYLGLTANRLAEIASDLEAENDGLREELAKWERLAAGIKLPEYPMTQFRPKDAERATVTLRVRMLDRAPVHGTGGGLVPIMECDPKGVAAKVLEEAAEVFVRWQTFEGMHSMGAPDGIDKTNLARLADGLADVITAACDLAKVYGLDLQAALDRNERRQIERGRIDG